MRAKQVGYYLLAIVVILPCVGCWVFRDFLPGATGLTLVEWELELSGYYTYALPDDVVKEMGWDREIYIWKFGCTQHASEANYNPISTRYNDEQGERAFSINVFHERYFYTPDNDPNVEPFPVSIPSEWIANHEAEYYLLESSDVTVVQFWDTYRADVRISAPMEPQALADLIAQIEYIGPDPETVGNPWDKACE